ncbi:hypothetical protein B0H16DRAFT_1736159 [Mycena metata]|uniref:Uncharacterized protein n=1 Tax=Mycena metata TaxID=1033252 RepID=A0AAD7MGF4_9AGAR|nr:hypothetical protein B0H16DRAFT_1741431 [Mycena metata]KAJ7725496.1 hypothetical protein B0H16DRAFT_1736159 [Mycena metata]
MSSAARPCQAEDSDGDECDCESFAPKSSQPKVCRRCMHLKKQHPQVDETVASIVSKVKAEHEADSSMLSKINQAKRESLDGMRPKTGLKLKLPKDKTLQPVDDHIPNLALIQTLINLGLAVRKDGRFEISLSATHEDIVDLLSEALPGPMAYFEHLGPTVFTNAVAGLDLQAPPWVLLTRVKQHLEIVQVVHPAGIDLFTHRGKNATPGERFIFISWRSPIPVNEKNSWKKTEMLAFMPESDSAEGESGSENAGDTPKPTKQQGKGRKRRSSVAFDDSDDLLDDEVSFKTEVKAKRRVTRNNNIDVTLPTIFKDSIAQEISASSPPVAGPSRLPSAIAGPSRVANTSTEPIDLTGGGSRSPSPNIPSFMFAKTATTTPSHQLAIDPSSSDPVEYTYGPGPRAIPKFY